YGLGAFHSAVFEPISKDQQHDLADVYQSLLRQNELAGFEVRERFYEIGSRMGIEDLERYLAASKRRAVFLDRDGVLNEAIVRNGRPHPPTRPDELKIIPEAGAALRRLQQAGFLLIVVTNQPDVARGAQTRAAVEELNAAVGAALPVDDF